MVLFVARVNGFQLLTIVTKSSTLNATGSQNLLLNRVFDTALTYLQCFFCHWRKILNTLIYEFYSPSNDSSRNSYKTTIFFIFIQYWAPILSLCLFSFHESEILKMWRHRAREHVVFVITCDKEEIRLKNCLILRDVNFEQPLIILFSLWNTND